MGARPFSFLRTTEFLMRQLHPAHRLFCWLLAVVAIQCISGIGLVFVLSVVLLSGRAILLRFFRLLRRARWLLFSLFVILAWGVAGDPLWENGGALVPTAEGISEAFTQIGRLLLVLAAVAALLETTPIDSLMAGCRELLQPLRHIGLDVDRAVIRLSLALYYAEAAPAHDWKQLLMATDVPLAPGTVCLTLPDVRWHDRVAVMLAVALLFMVCMA
ncbi:MAG: hypothetical protein QG592_620 [Pseudomonadota bacterium]|nr:hypothetical protein [Pseudomonadota bacterium]MDQ5959541.1 hypothetical protein [Pseudomonadota bacterium]